MFKTLNKYFNYDICKDHRDNEKPKILIYSQRTQVQSDEATQEYQAMTNRSG